MDTTVRELLDMKEHEVVTIDRDANVFEAVRRMVTCKVGSVIVAEDSSFEGIFTERDYMRRVVLPGRSARDTLVGDVMTQFIYFAELEDTLHDCMRAMTVHRCRHLPVVHRRRLVGIVSIGDCVALLCEQLQKENHLLHEYICGPLSA
jgi:signal-transduction protein with cAMP-binding, CBS, and nucleotidyltransferase domain